MPSRLSRGAALLLGLLGALAVPALARERVVVLDRGHAARADEARWLRIAGDLVRSGGAQVVIYGTREDGRARIGAVRASLAEVLDGRSPQAGWSFEGPTDPRKALEYVARRRGEEGPLDVFLVGPFSDGEGTVAEWGGRWRKTWLERIPEGSRILPIGLDAGALALLGDYPGLVLRGWLVHSLDRVEAVPEPYSPFGDPASGARRRRSRLDLMLGLAAIGTGLERPPYVVSTGEARDAIEVRPGDDRLTVLVARDPGGSDDLFRVRFTPTDDPRVIHLVPPPPVLEVRAGVLGEDARLLAADGGEAQPFLASGVQAGAPRRATYALVRSATGKTIPWRIRDAEGRLPPGLDVSLGPESARGPDVRARDLVLVFAAERGRPVEASGVLLVDEPGGRYSFRLPYRVSAPPGRVRVRLLAPGDPQGLPFAGDAPWRLEVARLDANAPARIRLRFVVEPADAAARLEVVKAPDLLEEGLPHPLTLPLGVPVGGTSHFQIRADDAASSFRGARVSVALEPDPGVRAEISGSGTLRGRAPRIRFENLEAARYAVGRGGAVEGDPPLRLILDPDGGDGAWRRHLAATPPTLAVAPDAPLDWRLEEDAPGVWLLLPAGPWRGPPREAFASREVEVVPEIRWSAGAAPEAAGLGVRVPARWGAAGWILVLLALLALILALVVALHMRPPPLEGTLLYAIQGKEGVVGRLDLSPVGRGRAPLLADGAGRLSLGGGGTPVATVESTRVGGFLRLPSSGEDAGGSHLLVDGLEVQTPRHRLRYFSGRPDDTRVAVDPAAVPDLLGPEFDLEGGRIGAVDPRSPAASGRRTAPGGGDARSQ